MCRPWKNTEVRGRKLECIMTFHQDIRHPASHFSPPAAEAQRNEP